MKHKAAIILSKEALERLLDPNDPEVEVALQAAAMNFIRNKWLKVKFDNEVGEKIRDAANKYVEQASMRYLLPCPNGVKALSNEFRVKIKEALEDETRAVIAEEVAKALDEQNIRTTIRLTIAQVKQNIMKFEQDARLDTREIIKNCVKEGLSKL